MSRGPGRLELAIKAVLDGEPDNAFTTDDLCRRVYPGINKVEKKHRVSVTRAARNIANRHDSFGCLRTENLGGTCVWFRTDSLLSYAMAKIKAASFTYYQSNDPRIPDHQKKSEDVLRAMLAPGGRYHGYIVPGGAWWSHVESWREEREAKLACDDNRLHAIYAEREAKNRRIRRRLGLAT
ncbi:MAG: hypothetical protein HC829_02470 [Bacteroidales bacterium]|nr:hypothetical protein [Bacteroidales bacterium]